jgi:cytochrome b involved in lipid metabolism
MTTHPGGRFSLEQNIGRDITKFFYGAQKMENNNNFLKPYRHSNIARIIV